MLTGYQHFNKNIIPYLYITTIKIEGITRGKIRENLLSFPFYLLPLVSKVVTFIKKSGHLFSRDKLLFYRPLKPIYYDNKSKHFIFQVSFQGNRNRGSTSLPDSRGKTGEPHVPRGIHTHSFQAKNGLDGKSK